MADREHEKLKVGDLVAISHGYSEFSLARIERMTPTQFIVGNSRFARKNGYKVGEYSSWSRPYIFVPSPEKLKEIRRSLLEKEITSAWRYPSKFSHETIEQIAELLNVKLEY